jgi:hypothetical protein
MTLQTRYFWIESMMHQTIQCMSENPENYLTRANLSRKTSIDSLSTIFFSESLACWAVLAVLYIQMRSFEALRVDIRARSSSFVIYM